MSTQRLTFLYPHLFRAARLGEPAAQVTKARYRNSPPATSKHGSPQYATSTFSTSVRAPQAVFERHGKAIEPLPIAPDVVNVPGSDGNPVPSGTVEPEKKDAPADETSQREEKEEDRPIESESSVLEDEDAHDDTEPLSPPRTTNPTVQHASTEETMQSSGPMDAVLHMPPPSDKHPHISTPPYVHHFDSYTLVKQLQTGGYTTAQAVTVMKGVRKLLAQNLDVAQEGLVSKSDVDNETYLFRAACSELSAEVINNRRVANEQSRQQRTMLQYEVDNIGQRLSQDAMTLKDDVRGMFNDRKMAVREEQKRTESAIQQVNLDISVKLTSDAKSEIEGLRWVLIRRSVLGIIFMAVLTLGTLRYATHVTHQREKEAEARAREQETMKKGDGRHDHAPSPEAAEILAAN